MLVDEEHIERAVNAYLTLQKTMAEGAGAAGLAAMLAEPERFRGRKVGLVLCGGNIDPRILASIMVRELERDDRIVSFRLTITDRPGLLGQIATTLGRLGANILEVDHRRLFLDVPAKGARLDVTVETRDRAHAEEIVRALTAEGFAPVRIEPAPRWSAANRYATLVSRAADAAAERASARPTRLRYWPSDSGAAGFRRHPAPGRHGIASRPIAATIAWARWRGAWLGAGAAAARRRRPRDPGWAELGPAATGARRCHGQALQLPRPSFRRTW